MAKTPRIKVGDPAPNITVTDQHGAAVQMAQVWSRGRLTLVTFLRHFG